MNSTMIAPKMKLSTRVISRLFSGELNLLRHLSTTSYPPQNLPETTPKINRSELYRKLSGVGLSGQNVTNVLHQLTENGFNLKNDDLIFCLKKLRSYRRYNDSFQILEWMEKTQKGSSDFSTYALHLDLTSKIKGIDEAERYFNNLPPHAKKPFVYGAMLNCYCSKKMVVKALGFFRKMEEMNGVSDTLAFNNIMGLYMKVDQPENVAPLIQEMKQRNILLGGISYHIWLQSCGRLKDLAGIERVMEEIEGHDLCRNDWKIYSSLATAYVNVGHPGRAAFALRKLEDVLENSKSNERTVYHYLISLHAKIGNENSVFQAWGQLNSKFIECHNISYLIMLQALSHLDNIEGLKKVFVEWESRYKSYDVRLPSVAIGAYLRHGMFEEAELLLKDAMSRKAGQNLWFAHVSFMEYYCVEKQQIDSAIRHMEAAYSNGWKPQEAKLSPFFEYFKQEKDFHGAEKLCIMLKDVEAMDSRAYLWLLQTYVAAGKESSEMRQRMEKDGIDISSEHEELLSKICPN